jgi:hypothetical protein
MNMLADSITIWYVLQMITEKDTSITLTFKLTVRNFGFHADGQISNIRRTGILMRLDNSVNE